MSYYHYYADSIDNFLRDARKFALTTGSQTAYSSFDLAWFGQVSYRQLTARQRDWYFYWRSQLRAGHYLRSDLGYLLLHTYEILNLIGFQEPLAAYEYLVKLWRYYRVQPLDESRYPVAIWSHDPYASVPLHPLDRYWVDWIADFIHVHKLPVPVLDWYTEAVREGATLTDVHVFVEAWLRSELSLLDMPLRSLFALANYDPTRNKFYEEFQHQCNLDDRYRQAMLCIAEYQPTQSKSRKSLLVRTNRVYPIRHYAFAGAVHPQTNRSIELGVLPLRVSYRQLSQHLMSVIKYTENIFRERHHFRAKLRGFEIDDDWKQILDTTFEVRPKSIAINFRQVKEIAKKSEAIRARLITETEEEPETPIAQLLPGVIPTTVPVNRAGEAEKLSPQQLLVLKTLANHHWQIAQSALQELLGMAFAGVVIDELNGWAVDQLGDILVVTTVTDYLLVEDFRPEILELLQQFL